MKFEDKSEFQGNTHYPVANESVQRWKEVLKDIKVKVAAGIAGGGEISLFSLLPIVSEKLVLVDHSYVSLWAFIGKYNLIEKVGAEAAIKLLTSPPVHSRSGGYDRNGNRVPGGEYNSYGERFTDNNPYSHKLVKPQEELYACFLEANKGLATETDRMEECGWWPLQSLNVRWGEIGVEDVEAAMKSKADLQVYHGDISDLVEHAPVELLYLSNALQYAGRNGKAFKLGEIVEKGALIAWTDGGSTRPGVATIDVGGLKCKPIEAVKPKRASASMGLNSVVPPPATNYDGSWIYKLAEVI